VIVEQGLEPTVNREDLPVNCEYVFLQDENDFDPQRCFAAGIKHSDPDRQYFILSNSDIYLETLDIRANLRMCEQYDLVTGFDQIIDLSPEASAQLRATRRTSGVEINGNGSDNNGRCQFLSRHALSMTSEQLRVFHSPNFALRLTSK
jgi:hypothetical protein